MATMHSHDLLGGIGIWGPPCHSWGINLLPSRPHHSHSPPTRRLRADCRLSTLTLPPKSASWSDSFFTKRYLHAIATSCESESDEDSDNANPDFGPLLLKLAGSQRNGFFEARTTSARTAAARAASAATVQQNQHRRVSFADAHGLSLAKVCFFDQNEAPCDLILGGLRHSVSHEVSEMESESLDSSTSAPVASDSAMAAAKQARVCMADAAGEIITVGDQQQQPSEASQQQHQASGSATVRPPSPPVDVALSFLFALMPRRDISMSACSHGNANIHSQNNLVNNINPVALVAVRYNDCARAVEGTVSVANLAYDKDVCIRYSWDGWSTFAEEPSHYTGTATDSGRDLFAFALKLPDTAQVGSRLAFAVRYTAFTGRGHADSEKNNSNAGAEHHHDHDREDNNRNDIVKAGNPDNSKHNTKDSWQCGAEAPASGQTHHHRHSAGETFWDNNNGANYEALCTLPRLVR